jgi:hypothetical protein
MGAQSRSNRGHKVRATSCGSASSGVFSIWDSNGNGFTSNSYVGSVAPGWTLAGTGDYNGDGMNDLLWRNTTTGTFAEWQSNGNGFIQNVYVNRASRPAGHSNRAQPTCIRDHEEARVAKIMRRLAAQQMGTRCHSTLLPGCPACPRKRTSRGHAERSGKAESRMGAVAWAIRQRSVSHPRSSNRTCGFPASGSPTGFIVRHTKQGTNRKRHLRGARSFLRLATQLSLKDPDHSRCLQAHRANHRHLAFFESTPEVRALCSAGITRPQRSYDPVRLPPWPPPVATLRPLPSP